MANVNTSTLFNSSFYSVESAELCALLVAPWMSELLDCTPAADAEEMGREDTRLLACLSSLVPKTSAT